MSHQVVRSLRVAGALVALISLTACAKKPAEDPTSAQAAQPSPETPNKTQEEPSASIELSPSIARACGISETETYFAYNSSAVTDGAEGILNRLVECFTTGPLAHQTMALVGHADPRGEDEYNFTLGGSRAGSVARALRQKGLPAEQLQTTSRGELDARGSDESSWERDRKVAILLAQ